MTDAVESMEVSVTVMVAVEGDRGDDRDGDCGAADKGDNNTKELLRDFSFISLSTMAYDLLIISRARLV